MPRTNKTLALCDQIIARCQRLNATHRDDTLDECERIVADVERRAARRALRSAASDLNLLAAE